MVHVNHHHHVARQFGGDDAGVSTAVSVVLITAAKTFDGPIRGYSTPAVSQATQAANNEPNFANGGNVAPAAPLVGGGQQQGSNNANTQPAPAVAAPTQPVVPVAQPVQSSAAIQPSSELPAAAVPVVASSQASSPVSSAMSQQTTLAQSASTSAPATTSIPPPLASAQSSSTAAPPAAPEQTESKSGMSSGGKAGLAIGIIAILAILAAVAFWFRRRRAERNAQAQLLDNEKSSAAVARGPSVRAPAAAVSNKKDASAAPEMNEKAAASAGLAAVAAPTTRGRTPEPEKPATNPFADPTDAALAPAPLKVSSEKSRPVSPVSDKSATAVAPPRGPDGEPLNVHRVQLDFAPSMDDELELRQGQLVRMLHEYDDGWCLCVRLDRSKQGVCPRSCVSKNPVKPKPGQGPKSRPTTPQTQAAAQAQAQGRARKSSNAVPAPLNMNRPITPTQGPFGEGEYRAKEYEPSNLSNSPNQSPPSSPETKQGPAKGAKSD